MIFAPSIWTLEIDGQPTLAFEARKYRQAAEANNSSDDMLVYLIEVDDVGPSDKQPTNPGAFPPQRT